MFKKTKIKKKTNSGRVERYFSFIFKSCFLTHSSIFYMKT